MGVLMLKRTINIKECKTGDIIAKDVFTIYGALLATENTHLNDFIIKKLLENGIENLAVYEKDDTALEDSTFLQISFERLTKSYEGSVEELKIIINDIAVGKNLNTESVNTISNSLYNEISEKYNIIRCLSKIRSFDEYTYNHSVNVALYSMLLAKWLDMPEGQIKEVLKAGLFHDIGKSQVPSELINKRGELTNEEFNIVKRHPVYSREILMSVPNISDGILKGVLLHHERHDGTGYPAGIIGDKIHMYAKIIAVADVYDAITSERSYKKRVNPFETFRIFQNTGLGHFDTKTMMTFIQHISSYYIGATILMNNGKQGTVAYVAPHNISMPVIKIGDEYFDLAREKGLKIVDMVKL